MIMSDYEANFLNITFFYGSEAKLSYWTLIFYNKKCTFNLFNFLGHIVYQITYLFMLIAENCSKFSLKVTKAKKKLKDWLMNSLTVKSTEQDVGLHCDGMNIRTDDSPSPPSSIPPFIHPSLHPFLPPSLATWSQRAVTPEGEREAWWRDKGLERERQRERERESLRGPDEGERK